MKDDSDWLWMFVIALLAMYAHDWLVRASRRRGGDSGWRAGSRWNNQPTPPADVPVPVGLSPNSTGMVPGVDVSDEGCGCS